MRVEPANLDRGFCIYVNTFCQGPVPAIWGDSGFPVVFATLTEAQQETAEHTIKRLQQFIASERDFEDAITVEEYVVEVDVFSDGSIIDECGRRFGRER